MKSLIARQIERRIVEDTRLKIKNKIKRIDGSKNILDLGCGEYGSFDYNGLNVFCADINKERLKILNKKKERKFYVNANKKLPFKKNFFEIVIFSGVIQYLENPENSIKEIYRIINKNGILILVTVNRCSLLRRIGLISKEAKKYAGERKIFSKDELVQILERNNFKIEMIKGADFLPMPKNLSSNLLFICRK